MSWCDVVATPFDFAFVYVEGNDVVCSFSTGALWRVTAPEPLMFLRAGVKADGTVVAAGQGNVTGTCWLTVGGAPFVSAGPTFGVQPVAFRGEQLLVVRTSTLIEVLGLNGEIVEPPLEQLASSQGIRDVTPEGQIRRADDWFFRDFPLGRLIEPSERQGVTVGQLDPPQIAGNGPTGGFTAILGEAYEPHIAYRNGRWAICARTPHGPHLVVVPPYPALVGATPAAPDPQPTPIPEPPKPMPQTPDESAFVASFLRSRLKALGDPDATRANSFAAVNACCLALRAVDQKWGLLEKTGGDRVRDRATDILLYDLGNGTAQVVDVVGDAEGNPSPGWSVKDIRPIAQWKLPYPADTPVPAPAPTPAPVVDLSAVLKRLDALELVTRQFNNDLANVEARVTVCENVTGILNQQVVDLAARPAVKGHIKGQTGRTFGHAHSFEGTVE